MDFLLSCFANLNVLIFVVLVSVAVDAVKAPKCYNIFSQNYECHEIKGKPPTSKFLPIKELAISVCGFNFECKPGFIRLNFPRQGWRMVKSETRRDAEILVRNPSPRLFGEKFRYSKKVKTNHEKTRLRDLSKTFPRFRDRAKIFRDPRFSRYHSPPLSSLTRARPSEIERTRFAWIHV